MRQPLPCAAVRPWTSTTLDPRRNRLLAALSSADLDLLAPAFEPVSMHYREQLYEPGQPLAHVYFPLAGLISLLAASQGGGSVEVGPIGREGMVGLAVFLGAASDPLHALAQVVPCLALRVPAADFDRAVDRSASLQRVLRRYARWCLAGMAQWILCARLHPVEERMARWLLMCHDRLEGNTLALTHEFLAQMLGVRRPTVSLAASTLQKSGLIHYSRGVVSILDRAGLEAIACECHRVSRHEYQRLLGRPPSG